MTHIGIDYANFKNGEYGTVWMDTTDQSAPIYWEPDHRVVTVKTPFTTKDADADPGKAVHLVLSWDEKERPTA